MKDVAVVMINLLVTIVKNLEQTFLFVTLVQKAISKNQTNVLPAKICLDLNAVINQKNFIYKIFLIFFFYLTTYSTKLN